MKWLQEVRRSGTTADKVAAMTLLLQESALANLRSLDELLRWVGKSSGARGVAGQVWYIRACPIECSFRELCEAQRFHAPENRYLKNKYNSEHCNWVVLQTEAAKKNTRA